MTQLPTVTTILLLAWLTEALVEYFARPWLKPAPARATGLDPSQNPTPVGARSPRPGSPPTDDTPTDDPPATDAASNKPLALRYAAMALGVLLAVAYQADLLALVGLVSPFSPYVGYVVTGLIIGRGSNFLHDLADRWL